MSLETIPTITTKKMSHDRDQDHHQEEEISIEKAVENGLHAPVALSLDEQPATPLRRENAFSLHSETPATTTATSRAASAQSQAVRSDAATLFDEELKEISAAHKRQCAALSQMRLAHMKQWYEQMSATMMKLEIACDTSRTRSADARWNAIVASCWFPERYLDRRHVALLEMKIRQMNEAALRSVTTVGVASTILETCTVKIKVARDALQRAMHQIAIHLEQLKRVLDVYAADGKTMVTKEALTEAARKYYDFLEQEGRIQLYMEQHFIYDHHVNVFPQIMQELKRARLLQHILNDDVPTAAEDTFEDEEDDDGDDDASEESD